MRRRKKEKDTGPPGVRISPSSFLRAETAEGRRLVAGLFLSLFVAAAFRLAFPPLLFAATMTATRCLPRFLGRLFSLQMEVNKT